MRRSHSNDFFRGADLRRLNTGSGSLLQRPYRDDPIVNRCARVIADALSTIRLRVVDGEGEDATEVTDSPLAKLFKRPNIWQESNAKSQKQLLRSISNAMQLRGECLLLLTDKRGLPLATPEMGPDAVIAVPDFIWPVAGGRGHARPIPGPAGETIGWEVNQDGGMRRYGAASVVVLKFDDPDNPKRGIAPLAAALRAANQNALAGRFQDNLLSRNGDPGGVIQVPDTLQEDDEDRLQEEIEERWDSIDFAGETRILWGGAEYKPNKAGPRDVQYPILTSQNREVISLVFGVPPALLGRGSVNFATFQGELRVFWTMTEVPFAELIQDALNCELMMGRLRGVPSTHRLRFDFSSVSALQGNLKDMAESAGALTKIGVPLNRALEKTKIEMEAPIEGGDVGLVTAGLKPIKDVAAGLVDPVLPPLPPTPPQEEVEDDPKKAAISSTQTREALVPDPDAEDPTATREGREDALARIRGVLQPEEDWLNSKIRMVFMNMRSAQLALFEEQAKGDETFQLTARRLYSETAPRVSDRSYELLLKAFGDDSIEKRKLLEKGKLKRKDQHWPRLKDWLDRRPKARDHAQGTEYRIHEEGDDLPAGARRLLDLARLKALDIPEQEIDRLVAVMGAEFREALERWLQEGATRGFAAGRASVDVELGSGLFVSSSDPALVIALRDKAIKVAEGVQSTVARQVRTTIIQTLTEHSTVGSLQMRLLEAFDELEKATRQSFNMHARRARTIARTELGQASSIARHEKLNHGMETGALEGARWVTSVPKNLAPPLEQGGFVREQHHGMDGKKRSAGGVYVMPDGTLLRHPRDPLGDAHQVINCKCDELGIVSKVAAGDKPAAA